MSEEYRFLRDNDVFSEKLERMSPVLWDYLESGVGQAVFDRLAVSRRERQLMTLAALAARRASRGQIATHTRIGLAAGATPDELLTVAEHAAVYAGAPYALEALKAIHAELSTSGWPNWAGTARVRVAGRDVRYIDSGGSGPVLVLCHALALDHRMWVDVVRAMPPGLRVVVPDLPGHGPGETHMSEDIADVAVQLLQFLDAIGVDRFGLAGISMGGAIAQHVAVQAGERVERLALLATMVQGHPAFAQRAEAAEAGGMSDLIAPTLVRWFTSEELAADLPGVRYARARLEKTPVARWVSAWRSLAAHDASGSLGGLRCPVLCVGGAEDASCPATVIGSLQAACTGAERIEIVGGSHLFPLTRPQETASVLTDWFGGG